MYLLLLLVGALGFVAMTFLGMAHGAGAHHSNNLAHPKVNLHHGGARGTHGQPRSGRLSSSHSGGDPWRLLMAISPIDIFSIALGAGAAGTLLKTVFSGWSLGLCAAAGGAIFALGVIRPLMGFLMKFASRPSEGLEGEVSSIGEALSRFDSQGRGVIRLILDEQVSQLLATLDKGEKESGVLVAKGDKVVIISVDPARNTCVVSRELAPSQFEATLKNET